MYERLTKCEVDGCASVNGCSPIDKDMANAIDRLCDLEDKIEQGKIVELPYRVGDTLWKIEDVWHLDDRATWKYHYEKEILEFMVRSISISCNSKGVWTKKFRICEVQNGKTINTQYNIEFGDYGKTVFLDRATAEAKLHEMEGDNNA
jgi:hypothetical protein